jgi:hypothetical protein
MGLSQLGLEIIKDGIANALTEDMTIEQEIRAAIGVAESL